jgi:DNA mismatch repair protein MutS
MMIEYNAGKAQNPSFLLFYRTDDFYELYFDDALICARVTGLPLVQRNEREGMDIPISCMPVERCEDYLDMLLCEGHGVAVRERLEYPPEEKERRPELTSRRGVVR